MRTPPPALLPVFRSRLTGDLLALMMADPDRKWTAEELASRTGAAYPTVTRELRRLHEAQLVLSEAVGRSKLWRGNERNPHFQPLATLAVSSFGPPQVLAEQLADVPGIDEVYLFGSWAARAAGEPGPTPGDIDVLVLGRATRRDVNRAMRRAEERLGREVNAVVRTRDEWEAADDGFTRQVKSSPLFAVEGPWRSYDPEDASVEKGRGRDRTVLEQRHLEHVPADAQTVTALLDAARRHVASARALVGSDSEGAYAIAYDAARKSATALLAHQGLRPTSAGGHGALVEATGAQFPDVRGLSDLDTLRRRRNQAEYPDPAGYAKVTSDEVQEAIEAAGDALDAATRLIEAPQLGVF